MNPIHTASVHRIMLDVFREWGDADEQLIIAYCSLGLDWSVSNSDAAAFEAGGPLTHEKRIARTCEVVLVRHMQAGCLYPIPWRDYLREALLVPCEPGSPTYAGQAAIKRALKGWRRTTPPWLDKPLRSLRSNADWRVCIKTIVAKLSDGIWTLKPIADRPDYKVGATFFRQRIPPGVGL